MPFFLDVAYNAAHWPYQPPDPPSRAPGNARHMQPHDDGTSVRSQYVAMLERADRGVGEILRTLERLGLAQNTLVIFTNDNGGEWLARDEPLFHRKQTLWEGGIRVPALVRWPGRIPAGRVSDQVGITMDLTASILAATGTAVPDSVRLEGLNLLPILEGMAPEVERTLFWRNVTPHAQRAVRRGDWKLLVDGGPNGPELLFNLRQDVGERHDMASQRQDIAKALRPLLAAWEADVDAEAKTSRDATGLSGRSALDCAPRSGGMRTRRAAASFLIAVAIVVAGPPASYADDSGALLSGYTMTSWTLTDGVPLGPVYAMAQDAEGFLWLGTTSGVVRFDGTRFSTWDTIFPVPLPRGDVQALAWSRRAALWVGFGRLGGGTTVGELRNGVLTRVSAGTAPRATTTAVLEDGAGRVWAVSDSALYRLRDGRWDVIKDGALGRAEVISVREDRHGAIWIGTRQGVFRTRDGDRFELVDDGVSRETSEGADGELWTTDPVHGARRQARARR